MDSVEEVMFYCLGVADFASGKKLEENPFNVKTEGVAFVLWRDGWFTSRDGEEFNV